MKKLGKMKLNDFHTMSEAEMKDILGGYLCMVYPGNQSSGISGWCEEHPMKDGIYTHPDNKELRIDCRPSMRSWYCKDYS